MKPIPADLLVVNAGELVTMAGPARPRVRAEMGAPERIFGGAVAVRGGTILGVGRTASVTRLYRAPKTLDAAGRLVTPGLVDAHTHLVFAATREREFEMRCRGTPYMEIAAAGGGILSSVRHLRAASVAQLVRRTRPRLEEMLRHGTTTAEVKSGYGLTLRDEIKTLKAIRRLRTPMTLVPTFLGAHEIPQEYRRRRKAYVDLVVEKMLPAVARRGLARFCDVFCEQGVFTVPESRRVLTAARELGLGLKIHAEEFADIGGARMAAGLGAVSADHLTAINARGIRAMAEAGTIAVLLPATTFFLGGKRYAPARRLIKAGVPVALATDFNPGSSMTSNLPLVMTIACTQMKLTPAEALTATTVNGAHAVGLGGEVGSLEPGRRADLVIWDAPTLEYLPYHFGTNRVAEVVKAGRRI